MNEEIKELSQFYAQDWFTYHVSRRTKVQLEKHIAECLRRYYETLVSKTNEWQPIETFTLNLGIQSALLLFQDGRYFVGTQLDKTKYIRNPAIRWMKLPIYEEE